MNYVLLGFLALLLAIASCSCTGEAMQHCAGERCQATDGIAAERGSGDLSPWDGAQIPDLWPAQDKGIPCPSKVLCGAAKNICCKAGEICYGVKCLKPGKGCIMHSDCPYGHFCDPVYKVCLPFNAAFCQYKPPAGKFSPTPEWTWTGSKVMPNHYDVLAPPVVTHLNDDNKNGTLGAGDIPDVVVVTYPDVSGHPVNIYRDGILRAIDGRTGVERWAVTDKTQRLVSGSSLAVADINNDNWPEIVGVDDKYTIKAFDHQGKLLWTSNAKVACSTEKSKPWYGWGGGVSIADLEADGKPEIIFDRTVFDNTGKLKWKGGSGGCAAPWPNYGPLSVAANLDSDPKGTLELVVGNRAYKHTGALLWHQKSALDGYPAVADVFVDGDPDVVLVAQGKIYVLDGDTGKIEWGPVKFPYPSGGSASLAGPGGPPTISDFDGDKRPEFAVAGGYYYVVFDPDCKQGGTKALCASGAVNGILWKASTKDLSSRVTGSSVFDFEGDGKTEVVYSDECFLRVYDGTTGKVLFEWSNNTRTATEAPIVADVDGDGRAEIVMVSNRRVWSCDKVKGWVPPKGWSANKPGYHGLTVLGDKADNWVGTRLIWNQHAYHVSNICDGIDQVCATAQNKYGKVPAPEKSNWTLPWLNNFRQNVQGLGVFNAPDLIGAQIKFDLNGCPIKLGVTFTVTNKGSAIVGAGLQSTLYFNNPASGGTALKTVSTSKALGPNESEVIKVQLVLPPTYKGDPFQLYVRVDDTGNGVGQRNECNENNNTVFAKTQCKGPS